jgi:hypothetical protein
MIDKSNPMLATHGGAGRISRDRMSSGRDGGTEPFAAAARWVR